MTDPFNEYILPNSEIALLKVIYRQQLRILTQQHELIKMFTVLVEQMAEEGIISLEVAAAVLDRLA